MKKTLALLLAMLVAFSMFSMAVAAEGTVKVTFVSDGIVIREVELAKGEAIIPDYVPQLEKEFITEIKDPETGDTSKTKHTFKGWKSSIDGEYYYEGTMPAASEDVIYTAEYMTEDYSERQSFWQLVESIFERINLLFRYFATIFNF